MQKTVLVTGASTGIGADAVRILVENNFRVVATVRKDEDSQILTQKFNNKVQIVKLDVTDFESVEKLPQILKDKFQITELFGLVNNAGIAFAGPFAHQNFSEIENIIRVNVLSLMKVTQVLLPLLGAFAGSKNPGRIINISSVAGKSALPFLSVYSASKHAVEGFSEGLRREMMLFGVKVVMVAPGSIKTPIWQKGFEKVKEHYQHTAFAASFSRFIKIVLKEEKNALEVSEVSSDILAALTCACPKLRYAPVPRKLVSWYLPMIIPKKMFDRLVAKVLGLGRLISAK